jgi:hypothetical protein
MLELLSLVNILLVLLTEQMDLLTTQTDGWYRQSVLVSETTFKCTMEAQQSMILSKKWEEPVKMVR